MTGRLWPRRYAAEKTHKRHPQRRALAKLELKVARRLVTPGCVSGGEAPRRDTTVLVEVFREPQLWLNYPAPFSGSRSQQKDVGSRSPAPHPSRKPIVTRSVTSTESSLEA